MNPTFVTYLEQFLGYPATNLMAAVFFLVAVSILVGVMATIGGLGTYAERKISADIQARIGPNRVGPFGLLQMLADGVKMILKEDIIPSKADKLIFILAPMMAMFGVFATLAVLPFSSGLTLTDLNIGVFYVLGVGSFVGVAIFLGGYASNSKWSMLGGMRGDSQIISYEIPVTLSILVAVTMAGGLSFSTLVEAQTGLPHGWYLFHNPFSFIAFFVLFIGALAETNRAPFDLPEAESELVSGYHTEYTGMRFGFFALAEYVEVFVVCGIAAALFLGGYKVPFDLGNGEVLSNALMNIPFLKMVVPMTNGTPIFKLLGSGLGQLLQLGSFFTKTLALYYVVIWIRWTLPRLRVDTLMTLCLKYLTPIALFNLLGAATWMVVFHGKSIYQIIFESGAAQAVGGH